MLKTNIPISFSYIRNRIRECHKNDLIELCLFFLKESENGNKNRIAINDVLLLLKWTLEYAGEKYPAKHVDVKKALSLVNLVTKLSGQHEFYLGKGNLDLKKFVSIIAYSQSYFQLPFWKDSFARQIILYTKLSSKTSIEIAFYRQSGISINDYMLLTFIFWAYADPDNKTNRGPFDGIVRTDFLELAQQVVNENTANRYLDLLSIDLNTAIQKIRTEQKVKNFNYQPFEISLFARYPLLKNGAIIRLVHKDLLKYTFNHFIYDFLKDGNNLGFTEEFGARLEKYIELGLKELEFNYKTETFLKKELPKNSKVVDFMIDDNILIECKAIELKPYPNIFPDDTVRYNWLKGSIVKAYSQQLTTVANLVMPEKIKYGIIITNKETYFGNGKDAWESFLEIPTKEYCQANNLSLSVLPPENLFFIDIATWDRLLMVIKHNQISLIEVLEHAKKMDSIDKTKKFLFNMHLADFDIGAVNLDYLNEAFTFFDVITNSSQK